MLRIRTDEAPVLVDSPLIPGRYRRARETPAAGAR